MVKNEQQGEFFRAGTAELLRIFVDARAFLGRGYQKFSKSGDLSLFSEKRAGVIELHHFSEKRAGGTVDRHHFQTTANTITNFTIN